MGIDEGTASLFVDSWRAGNCPAALERETDPCSMSQLNSKFPVPHTHTFSHLSLLGWDQDTHSYTRCLQRCVQRPTAPCC